jgi:hypothetical protein
MAWAATIHTSVFMIFECLFNAIARLAFALNVIWMVIQARPALVGSTDGVVRSHQVFARLVVVDTAVRVFSARRVGGNAVERSMPADGVGDFFTWCSFQGLGIRFG